MDSKPSRLYSTEDVVGMVLQDEVENQQPLKVDDPDFEEPVCYGSDDECGLVKEEISEDGDDWGSWSKSEQ